jgi:alpha-tubulin suppressor-like RCC1 family protein
LILNNLKQQIQKLHIMKKILLILFVFNFSLSFGQSIAGGDHHSLFLCADSTVKSCGWNDYGQLGDTNSLPWRSTPFQLSLAGVIKVSTGSSHSLFLKNDGTVWACGQNIGGCLGDNSTIQRITPVQSLAPSGIIAIATGNNFSLFLKNDGTVWACGQNTHGQLGDGTTTARPYPIQVPGLTNVVAIAAGYYHSLFLISDGSVWGCGSDYNGQLGDYSQYVDRRSPILVYTISNVKGIAAGGDASLFLKNDSTVWGCGDGSNGQLGAASGGQFTTNARRDTLLSGIVALSTGTDHSLFLKGNGTVWGCGYNYYGQLGLGSTPSTGDMQLPGLAGIISIHAGNNLSFFIKNDSTVLGCGYNRYGELGDGTTIQRNTVIPIPGLSSIVNISGNTGLHCICAKSDGTALTWGWNRNGQLGDGAVLQRNTAVSVTGLTGVIQVEGGGTASRNSIFLKSDGTAWGCGWNVNGQLGDGTTNPHSTVIQIPGLSGIVAIAEGYGHSLFLKNNGTVWACGWNATGALGDGTTIDRTSVVQVTGLSGIIGISAGGGHSLFLKNDGTVWACGDNTNGQLGDSTTIQRTTPIQITSLSGIIAVSGGVQFSLFIKSNGTAWACGQNGGGQLGDSSNIRRLTPVQVNGLQNVIKVSGGGNHSLFLKNDGTAWSCGSNYWGQLGDGTTINRNIPGQVPGLAGVIDILAEQDYCLFAKGDGTAWGCGYNFFGQLGIGTHSQFNSTVQQALSLCSILTVCPTAQASAVANVSCNGGNNGVAFANVIGGTPSYTYQWMPSGGNTATANNLAAGSYTVNVTDANSCSTSSIVTITQPAALIATASAAGNVSCNGGNNGVAFVNASGGTASYTYQWMPSGGNGATASNLYTGTYSVVVTDANGCNTSATVIVSEPSAALSSTANSTNVSCNQTNGAIDLSVIGGTLPYAYLWSNGAITEDLINVAAGTYTVTITDSNGCTQTQTATINSSGNAPAATATPSGNTYICRNTTGNVYSVTLVTGATSYFWTAPAGATITSGQNTNSVTLTFSSSQASGNLCVYASNACGNGPVTCKPLVVVTAKPPAPTSISGSSVGCPSTSGNYSCPTVANANFYTWTMPVGASIASGQGTNNITLNFSSTFAGGTIKVSAGNCKGNSANISKNISSVPGTPGQISGPNSACTNQTVAYSVPAVTGATYYQWSAPAGSVIASGQGTNSVTVTFGASGGTLSVRAGNACGLGNPRNKSITVNCSLRPESAGDLLDYSSISVYPNPTADNLTIESSNGYLLSGITIYSTDGRKVHEEILTSKSKKVELNLSELAAGVYFLDCVGEKSREMVRLVKY